MTLFKLTDGQVIERVRKAQRIRRPLGAFFLCAGLIGAALLGYWMHYLYAQLHTMLNELVATPHPTTQQMDKAMHETQFAVGFNFGFLAAIVWISIVQFLGLGVGWLLFRNRKDRLLLQCWDRQPPTP